MACGRSGVETLLPLGISFYTFTQIAYLADVYANKAQEYAPANYALFVTWFPHLIAGPIMHHREMMPQFATAFRAKIDPRLVLIGLSIFSVGLAKKVLLADQAAPFADAVFDRGALLPLTFAEAWVGALAYTMQIYFDFSGYSDMAIGLSLMFGVRLPVNFNSPYKSKSIIEFWRRWHMTLSRFLRDYVYIPLGGNRRGPVRRYANLMATMLIGGLWHGAGWTFVIWGALHGLYLMANHAWNAAGGRLPKPVADGCYVLRGRHRLGVLSSIGFHGGVCRTAADGARKRARSAVVVGRVARVVRVARSSFRRSVRQWDLFGAARFPHTRHSAGRGLAPA